MVHKGLFVLAFVMFVFREPVEAAFAAALAFLVWTTGWDD